MCLVKTSLADGGKIWQEHSPICFRVREYPLRLLKGFVAIVMDGKKYCEQLLTDNNLKRKYMTP